MPSVTITVTASQATRAAAALGTAQGLGRPATAEEVRLFLIGRLKQLVIDVEGTALTKAAIAAVVVPTFEPM